MGLCDSKLDQEIGKIVDQEDGYTPHGQFKKEAKLKKLKIKPEIVDF